MKIKKLFIIIILAVVLITAALIVWIFSQSEKVDSVPFNAQYNDQTFFLSAIKQSSQKSDGEKITGLIVPHHLLAKDLIADVFADISGGQYQTIVLLSPNHFQAGQTDIATTARDFSTVFGTLNSDQSIAQRLKKLPFVGEGEFFYREHGLQAELPFIKYYFPEVKIIALSFKPETSKDELDQVIKILEEALPPDSLVIQSTDFSHYLTPAQAAAKDDETIAVINKTTDAGGLANILKLNQPDNLDSVAALYVQAALQADFFKTRPNIVAHKNSQDYTSEPVASSTSYLTVIYNKQ
jgi:poly-gamma-glutamate synthesis protein (capsule biosynthesis protein)